MESFHPLEISPHAKSILSPTASTKRKLYPLLLKVIPVTWAAFLMMYNGEKTTPKWFSSN